MLANKGNSVRDCTVSQPNLHIIDCVPSSDNRNETKRNESKKYSNIGTMSDRDKIQSLTRNIVSLVGNIKNVDFSRANMGSFSTKVLFNPTLFLLSCALFRRWRKSRC